ncbi:hypothetical protein [Leptospira yasudae]|uniref:DUF4181 domain-containing protein n=1 Tax=Leptospira yasudae TaxID=2202201 RepID=A0A6N4QU13_9LEPT|nr:hypothetical protein [Leptospira yasudae]TGL75737.1 hypothetical protein EHQ72_15715 [Leptospira yasudae]TGL78266.1 hypothetical protein EHQ77_11945 [Leptospira yasudae]TGL80078.1 hypothetical protein EHQ83_17410 [Leptospira yasudae]
MEPKDFLIVGTIHSLGFAVFHVFFWKIFRWKEDLKRVSFANRAILQIANLRLIYLFVFMAGVTFFFPTELLSSSLGKWILIGFSVFWWGRLIEQFIFLRVNSVMVHVLTVLFFAGGIVYLIPLFAF